jgi:metallo-beta-lactamase class B
MESRRTHLMKLAALAAVPLAGRLTAQTADELFKRNIGTPDQFNKQFPPHKVIGNIYYVGSESLASFLVVTPQGNILINSCFEATVPVIRDSVEKLGFKFTDIKILLGSHAHADHMEGDALVKELTGAQVMAMAEDVPALMKIRPGNKPHPLDKTLHDGGQVTLGDAKLGGTTLVAHLTAGHTRGCTTWTTQATENGKTYDVVIIGSVGVNPGFKLVNNTEVPDMAGEYMRSFKLLRSLPCDVPLGSHPAMYNLAEKYPKLGHGPNPFIDPEGYKHELDIQEHAFLERLAEQNRAATVREPVP